jgi:hypothetical protein
MAAGAQNLFNVQKPNVGGLGVGVRPMPEMAGQHYGLATPAELFRQQESIMAPSMPNVVTQTGTELTRANMGKTYGSQELKDLQVEYDRQEGIRQKKLEKLAELRGMEDLNAGVRAPASQRVGSGAGKIVPIASGPLKRPDDILNAPFLQGLY